PLSTTIGTSEFASWILATQSAPRPSGRFKSSSTTSNLSLSRDVTASASWATRVTCASPFFCERDRRKKSASSESSSTSNIFISSGAPCTAVNGRYQTERAGFRGAGHNSRGAALGCATRATEKVSNTSGSARCGNNAPSATNGRIELGSALLG